MSIDHNYTEADARDIFFGDHDDFEPEAVLEIDDGERRWHHDWTHIYKHKDGSLWAVSGSLGATEMQEHEFNDPPFRVEACTEIEPARKVTAFYTGSGQPNSRLGATKGEPVMQAFQAWKAPSTPVDAPLTQDAERRSWPEFRECGLLTVANTVLHWFGWTIVVATDDQTGAVVDVYPERTRYRGFDRETYNKRMLDLADWQARAGASLRADLDADGKTE